jgi:hypothetical protein
MVDLVNEPATGPRNAIELVRDPPVIFRALTAPGIPAASDADMAKVPLLTVAVPEFSQALLLVNTPPPTFRTAVPV